MNREQLTTAYLLDALPRAADAREPRMGVFLCHLRSRIFNLRIFSPGKMIMEILILLVFEYIISKEGISYEEYSGDNEGILQAYSITDI